MQTHEQALLAAVLADPDADAPRLIFADWLEENGQPERTEFIRNQVADPKWFARFHEIRTIPHGIIRDWWLQHPWIEMGSFQRGFLYSLTCTGDDWLRHADTITASQPVREVTWTRLPTIRLQSESITKNREHQLQMVAGVGANRFEVRLSIPYRDLVDSEGQELTQWRGEELKRHLLRGLLARWPSITFTCSNPPHADDLMYAAYIEVMRKPDIIQPLPDLPLMK